MELNSTVVVDTSVLVGFYLSDDVHHKQALQVLKAVNQSRLLLHPFVIQETVTVLTYKSGFSLARKFMSDIQNAKNISISSLDITKELATFQKLRQKISLTDSALVQLAIDTGSKLVSFDVQMLRIAKQVSEKKRRSPGS